VDLKTICKEAQKYGDAVVVLVNSNNTLLEMKNDEITSIKDNETQMLFVRISKGKKFGYSSTPNLKNWKETIANAVKIMKVSKPLKQEIPLASKSKLLKMRDISNNILNLNDEDFLKYAQDIKKSVKSVNSKFKIVESTLSKIISKSELLNSNGASSLQDLTEFNMTLAVGFKDIIEEEVHTDKEIFDVASYSNTLSNLVLKDMKIGKAPSKKLPVIIDYLALSDIFSSILTPSFNGYNVLNKRSFLWDKLGKEVFSQNLNIIDDGLKGLERQPTDMEGTPSKRTILVEKGKIRNFLYDLYSAKLVGKKSTSNCGSLAAIPSISPNNFKILPGKKSTEELINSIEEGVYIRNVMGTHTANPITGDLSLSIPSGFYIKDGKLSYAIRKSMINMNLFEALKDVELSKEVRQENEISSPNIKFNNIQLIS